MYTFSYYTEAAHTKLKYLLNLYGKKRKKISKKTTLSSIPKKHPDIVIFF